MRLAALIAAVAAAVNLLVLGLLDVVSPEVDPVTRAVSEYALGDFGWLATIGTVAEGVGAIALAVALRRERAAALLLLVFGLMKLAMPLFPVDAPGAPATNVGRVHSVLGILTFFLFPLAALLLFGALRRMGGCLSVTPSGCSAWSSVRIWFCARSGCSAPLQRYFATFVLDSVRLLQDEPVTALAAPTGPSSCSFYGMAWAMRATRGMCGWAWRRPQPRR
jgi:Protein of unknown function (DUF998)